MIREGRLIIDLHRAGDGIAKVGIVSRRPPRVAEVFKGRAAAEIPTAMPLLFSICAKAQGYAASHAVERALAVPPSQATQAARDALVRVETTRELMLGMALRWSALVEVDCDKEDLLQINGMIPVFQKALFGVQAPFAVGGACQLDGAAWDQAIDRHQALIERFALGVPAAQFRALETCADLCRWAESAHCLGAAFVKALLERGWADLGQCDGTHLPALEEDDLAEWLFATESGFDDGAPKWRDRACESTILSRHAGAPLVAAVMAAHGNGLLARAVARLFDLAQAGDDLRALREKMRGDGNSRAPSSHPGRGLAQVAAARGLLIHGVEVDDGVAVDYRIVAPTQWNFQTAGVAASSLAAVTACDGEDLARKAGLVIDAIDPCLGYELRIH